MYKQGYVLGLAALAVAGFALFAPAAQASSGDTVIAIVNGDKILKKDVMAALKTIPNQGGADQKDIFPMVVDQMINEKLIDDATSAAQVEKSEDYKKALDGLKAQLAKKIYLDKYLRDKVSESAVKGEYDKFKEENKGKPELHARHILVKTEDEAKEAIKDLNNGEKFEDLAKKMSADKASVSHGGDLGWFTKEEMDADFSDAAFKLSPGEHSKDPVHTRFGWHVIQVEDKRTREVPPMEQVAPAIRQKLAEVAVRDLILHLRAKAQIKMFDAEGKPLAYGGGGGDAAPAPAPAKGGKHSKGAAKEEPAAPVAADQGAATAKPADASSYGKSEGAPE
jgi:peptidyl-prolyl cis-trans isomerase C